MSRERPTSAHGVSFGEALRFWAKLGCISFGGPAGQIAIMHRELVERRRWISEARFLHALNYCMLLPGPEAMQLATYVGWLLHRTAGGIAAGALFVLPSIGVLLCLSWIYAAYGSLALVAGALGGVQPIVVAIVAEAVQRIGKRALKRPVHGAIAAAAFVGIHLAHVPFPAIVLGAGLLGFACGRLWPDLVEAQPRPAAGETSLPSGAAAAIDDAAPPAPHTLPSAARAGRILASFAVLWTVPYLALLFVFGSSGLPGLVYRFFTKAAFVTFGGAYAVLAYVMQVAVHAYGWLAPREAMVGLALAETTPGPLIMVLQFVGFMAGWHQPMSIGALPSAVVVALATTWATFLPCFLFIFLGAPHIERLRGNRDLAASLSFVTAAVVGVVLNLGVVFAAAVLVPESLDGAIDWTAGAIAVAAFWALSRQWSAVVLVLAGAALGLVRALLSA